MTFAEKPVEAQVLELEQWAAEGALGANDAEEMVSTILVAITTLRDRIDELGGYHDDL